MGMGWGLFSPPIILRENGARQHAFEISFDTLMSDNNQLSHVVLLAHALGHGNTGEGFELPRRIFKTFKNMRSPPPYFFPIGEFPAFKCLSEKEVE